MSYDLLTENRQEHRRKWTDKTTSCVEYSDTSEEQNTKDVPVHITTIVYDDESPAGQMNFTQNSIEAHHRRSLFGYKVRPEVVPWPEEHRVSPL